MHVGRSAQALLLAGAAALAPACGEAPTEPSGPLDQAIIIRRGHSTRVEDAGMTIRFDTVTGDSRCPIDAICIQGGDAVVQVTVLPFNGRSASYDLHTAAAASATHGSVTLTLEELVPYPFSSQPFDPSEYRATIRLTR